MKKTTKHIDECRRKMKSIQKHAKLVRLLNEKTMNSSKTNLSFYHNASNTEYQQSSS